MGARCDFETDTCGWANETERTDLLLVDSESDYAWLRISSKSASNVLQLQSAEKLPVDHSLQNSSGHFLYVPQGNTKSKAEQALIHSPWFPPVSLAAYDRESPNFGKCKLRFYFHDMGNEGHFVWLHVKRPGSKRERIWKYEAHGAALSNRRGAKQNDRFGWERAVVTIPRQDTKWRLEFSNYRVVTSFGHFAIDDLALSPQCFANGAQSSLHPPLPEVFEFTTCGANGAVGPTQEQCDMIYVNYTVHYVRIVPGSGGVQRWTIPQTLEYKVVADGAAGGIVDPSSLDSAQNLGSRVEAVLNLTEGNNLEIVVGQNGDGPCDLARFYEELNQDMYPWEPIFNRISETACGRLMAKDDPALAQLVTYVDKISKKYSLGGISNAKQVCEMIFNYRAQWPKGKQPEIINRLCGESSSDSSSRTRRSVLAQNLRADEFPGSGGGGATWVNS